MAVNEINIIIFSVKFIYFATFFVRRRSDSQKSGADEDGMQLKDTVRYTKTTPSEAEYVDVDNEKEPIEEQLCE